MSMDAMLQFFVLAGDEGQHWDIIAMMSTDQHNMFPSMAYARSRFGEYLAP